VRVTLPLAVVGVDFRRASTRWRAAMALDEAARREMHAALKSQGATSFAELSTCNRTEWIAVAEDPAWIAELLRGQATERFDAVERRTPRPYVHVGEEAAKHLLRVAIGQESLARGEPHIARQAHEAFARAREEGTACPVLNVVETVVGRTVRRAGRSAGRSSSHGMHRIVAEALIAERLPEAAPVLVVGMGAIGRKVADRVAQTHPVIRVNRTPSDGVRALADVLAAPPPHAAVVLCTGAPEAVWTTAQLGPDTRVVVDIGSPPQVDPAVGDRVRLIDLDALVAARAPTVADGATDEAVATGLDDLRRAMGVRALRDLVQASREEYRDLDRTALHKLIEGDR